MAGDKTALTTKVESGSPYQLDSAQILRASTALLKKLSGDEVSRKSNATKASLLDDADASDEEGANDNSTPVWLVLTTKKHMTDQKRMKPGKIVVPHPLQTSASPSLRVCLITSDPQRKYKDIIADPRFPTALSSRISRVLGMEKLKSKYKTYESRRQLFAEYDMFLADDRVSTYLPKTLGKVFYASGAKRPIPVALQGRADNSHDEQGNKRVKLADGGVKVKRSDITPEAMAHELERAIGAALVHLAPSTNTSVKVAKASFTPEQVAANISTVVAALTDKYVPKGWKNVRAIHIKGPNTAALPIWLAEELWEDDADVLEKLPEAVAAGQVKKDKKKRKRALLEAENKGDDEEGAKKRKSDEGVEKKFKGEDVAEKKVKTEEAAAEKAVRKAALKKQKEDAKAAVAAAAA